jgi:hypothetical protein
MTGFFKLIEQLRWGAGPRPAGGTGPGCCARAAAAPPRSRPPRLAPFSAAPTTSRCPAERARPVPARPSPPPLPPRSTQDEPAFCGLASLAMVLNALSIDPRRTWKGSWRWFHEKLLDCCLPLDKVAAEGIVLSQVGVWVGVRVAGAGYGAGRGQGAAAGAAGALFAGKPRGLDPPATHPSLDRARPPRPARPRASPSATARASRCTVPAHSRCPRSGRRCSSARAAARSTLWCPTAARRSCRRGTATSAPSAASTRAATWRSSWTRCRGGKGGWGEGGVMVQGLPPPVAVPSATSLLGSAPQTHPTTLNHPTAPPRPTPPHPTSPQNTPGALQVPAPLGAHPAAV